MSKELSDLLPDFLSRKGDEIYYRFRGDEDISELWDEYLKEARENEYQLADEIGRLKAKLKEAEEVHTRDMIVIDTLKKQLNNKR